MTKKKVGYVKLVWTCPRCSTRNPGPNKFCNGCGGPQPEDVQFEQPLEAELIKDSDEIARAKAGPDVHCPYCGARNPSGVKFCGACGGDLAGGKARASGQVVGAFRAPSSATRPCPACGTANPLTSVNCSNCGAALPSEAAAPQPASRTPPPGSSRIGLYVGGGLGLVCLAVVAVVGLLSLRRTETVAHVESVAWERAIDVERYGPVEHEDWEDSLPSAAEDVRCQLEYRTTQSDPAPIATEVCGTPYTVDEGTGYGEVVQDCEYRVYDQMCSYTVDEWAVAQTVRSSGNDLNPGWPQLSLGSGERRGQEHESYTVLLRSADDTYRYAPATASEFSDFVADSEWTVVVNGLGAVVAVEAAP